MVEVPCRLRDECGMAAVDKGVDGMKRWILFGSLLGLVKGKTSLASLCSACQALSCLSRLKAPA